MSRQHAYELDSSNRYLHSCVARGLDTGLQHMNVPEEGWRLADNLFGRPGTFDRLYDELLRQTYGIEGSWNTLLPDGQAVEIKGGNYVYEIQELDELTEYMELAKTLGTIVLAYQEPNHVELLHPYSEETYAWGIDLLYEEQEGSCYNAPLGDLWLEMAVDHCGYRRLIAFPPEPARRE